jgi:hypothetical protein
MINPATLAFEDWLARGDAIRRRNIELYRDFYKGDHDIAITERQRVRLSMTTAQIRSLANVCQLVVDVVAERLSVNGFDAADETTAETLGQWWADGDLDAYQDDVHLCALRDGDGYLIVSWDGVEGRPVFHHEQADDGYNGTGLVYSSERRAALYGYKRWRIEEGEETGNQRLNLYFPDRTEKYITGRAGLWTQYQDADDTSWPLPWVDRAGLPLGIPVVHFPCNPNGDDYGTSELEAVIPLQRVLTSLWVDLLAAADATGFQLVTLTGDTPAEEMINAPRSIWYSQNEAAAFGSIPPGDISLLVEAIRHTTMTIAQVSRVPLTMFQDSKAVSSAETIVASERGLTAKVSDRAKSFGLAWRHAARLAVDLHNTYSTAAQLSPDKIRPRWASIEHVDPLAIEERRAMIAATHIANGLSVPAAYARAGYSGAALDEVTRTDTYGDEGLTQ